MGLESVELLIQFEKEFKKDVSDQEATYLCTVGDVVNWFMANLPLKQPDKNIRDVVLHSVKTAFDRLNLQRNFNGEDKLRDFIPKENLQNLWSSLEQELKLKIPKLNQQDLSNKKVHEVKLLGLTIFRPKPPILDMTFGRFVECIGALNYEQFVDFDNLTSEFEVVIAVIGITHKQCGIDVNEIYFNSSFTKDLGID